MYHLEGKPSPQQGFEHQNLSLLDLRGYQGLVLLQVVHQKRQYGFLSIALFKYFWFSIDLDQFSLMKLSPNA